MDISSIPEVDRNDFQKRMARLGLDEEAAVTEEMVVSSGATISLSMSEESSVRPLILQTSDLDTLRTWIGTPEKVVEQQKVAPFLRMAEIRPMLGGVSKAGSNLRRASINRKATTDMQGKKLVDVMKVNPDKLLDRIKQFKKESTSNGMSLESIEIDTIRLAARNYIRGDPGLVADYKPAIEAFFGNFEIAVWLFSTIRVKKNATLSLGTGINSLTAYQVIIEEGARITSRGHLTVNATKLRRSSGGGVFRLPDHVLTDTRRRTPFR